MSVRTSPRTKKISRARSRTGRGAVGGGFAASCLSINIVNYFLLR